MNSPSQKGHGTRRIARYILVDVYGKLVGKSAVRFMDPIDLYRGSIFHHKSTIQSPFSMSCVYLFKKRLKKSGTSCCFHLGNEKKPGCLGYIGDYTTQDLVMWGL